MTNRSSFTLEDFKLLALRSDGFYEARRKSDQELLLLRKITPEGGLSAAARQRFHQESARAGAFCGAGTLEVVLTFEDEDAFFVGLPYFDGRTVAVQIARGREFTFAEAWDIALKIARTLSRRKEPYGAILPSNVLLDEQQEVRLAPDIRCSREARPEPTVASDVRQLALFIGYLVFGGLAVPEPGETRAVGMWTMRPEVPVPCRAVLGHMLASGMSSSCQTWHGCLRDMERARHGPVAARKSMPAIGTLLMLTVMTAIIAGGWLWRRSAAPVQPPVTIAPNRPESAEVGVTKAKPGIPTKTKVPSVSPERAFSADMADVAGSKIKLRDKAQDAGAKIDRAVAIAATGTADGISLRRQPLVANAAAAPPHSLDDDDYPGLPKLTLSSSTPIGDPDFAQLVRTTRWVVEHGGWEHHRDVLDKTLVSAASLGTWFQRPENLDRILTLNTSSVMLSQDTVLHAIDPSIFEGLSNDRETKDFLAWLFTNPRAIALLAETLKPEDKPQRVIEIWRNCWKSDRDGAEKYMALALAVAVDFDDAISVNPGYFGMKQASGAGESESASTPANVDPVARYQFYRDSDIHGTLKVTLSDLEPYELVWVVDAPVPNSELAWAQKYVHLSRRDWGQAYSLIRYRMDKAAAGAEIYDSYTLAEIKDRGGICADQAYFAAITAKANGIPAMVIGGEGDRGAHAWVQWESTKDAWSEAGRYADNYAAGTTNDPQTHCTVKEQELREITAPQRRTAGWAMTERYLKLATLFSNTGQPELARLALDAAVQATPQHEAAWNRLLDSLVAAKASTEEWESEIARMRAAFQRYPDIIQEINRRETDYLATNGDAGAALAAVERQSKRFLARDNSRTDLILDGVFQAADLATDAGDTEKAGKIFRDALREKGREAVAFKAIAQRYYDWAQKQNQGAKALRDIDQTFERNFQPEGDYFELSAYHDSLAIVIDMCKKEGLEADAHRLERLSQKVEDNLRNLSERAKRNPGN